jgi:hypothetical protein
VLLILDGQHNTLITMFQLRMMDLQFLLLVAILLEL